MKEEGLDPARPADPLRLILKTTGTDQKDVF